MKPDCCLNFIDDSDLEKMHNFSPDSWEVGELSLNYICLPMSNTMRDVLICLDFHNKKSSNPKLYFSGHFKHLTYCLFLNIWMFFHDCQCRYYGVF